jgi:hypothetical protein
VSDETPKPSRQTYSTPTLVTYGDIVKLTRSSTGGKNDKGSGAQTRTA